MKFKKTLLIDLGGVLNLYDGKFDCEVIPPLKVGVKEFLEYLSNDYEVKIFTTRNRLLTSKWLIENSLDMFVSDITNVKDSAFLQIDNRCICFDVIFEKTLRKISDFIPYWK